jgi:hypothetical protein
MKVVGKVQQVSSTVAVADTTADRRLVIVTRTWPSDSRPVEGNGSDERSHQPESTGQAGDPKSP